MTKFKLSILTVLAVIVTGLTFTSCEKEEIKSLETENISTLKGISTNTKNKNIFGAKSGNVVESAELVFDHNGEDATILAGKTIDGTYLFDINNDQEIDFQVQPINETSFYYLDPDGNTISKANIIENGNIKYIDVVEIYDTAKYNNIMAKTNPWRDCFEGVASSAEGIVGAVACSFGGPWCVAGYYTGIALGCL